MDVRSITAVSGKALAAGFAGVTFIRGAPVAPDKIRWLNDREAHTIKIPLTPGTHTFTLHSESGRRWPMVGMNLFFDGAHEAAISVKAPMDTQGPPYPAFTRNNAPRTMGWPVTDIPGADSLRHDTPTGGLWQFVDPAKGVKVTLSSFRFSAAGVDGNLDLVGPHKLTPSGKPDFVGQFTLEVEPYTPKPSDLWVWLQTVAGVTAGGPDMVRTWKKQLDWENATAPFSFTYGGTTSQEVLRRCRRESTHRRLDDNRSAHTLLYTDPQTGLQVRWEGIEYRQLKTVEWTLYSKNTGSSDTPILADIRALDAQLQRPERSADQRSRGREFALHYNRGDTCLPNSYEPLRKLLGPTADVPRTARFRTSTSAQARKE